MFRHSKGQISSFGFEEILLIDKPKSPPKDGEKPPTSDENPIKVVAKQILESGMLSDMSSLEKIKMMKNSNFIEDMYERSVIFNPQIEEQIRLRKFDLIVLDHFTIPPAVYQAGVPYVIIFSGNPVCILNSKDLPPPCSGKLWG